jgi:hypothetical protein
MLSEARAADAAALLAWSRSLPDREVRDASRGQQHPRPRGQGTVRSGSPEEQVVHVRASRRSRGTHDLEREPGSTRSGQERPDQVGLGRDPSVPASRRTNGLRCFFDGAHGVGPCSGPVRLARGASKVTRSISTIVQGTGYCKAHEASNVKRAAWYSNPEIEALPDPSLKPRWQRDEDAKTEPIIYPKK